MFYRNDNSTFYYLFQSSPIVGNPFNGLISFTLEEFSTAENFETDTYCNGTMVEIAGNIYTEDTNIQLLLEDGSINGCDSIIHVDIKFDNASYNRTDNLPRG